MKKIIFLILTAFLLSGCSLIKPVISAVTPTVSKVPQKTEKSSRIVKCKGDIIFNDDGSITCSSGFYLKESSNVVQERKLTLKEKILQFLNKFFGLSIIIAIVLIFICPSLLVSIFFGIINKWKKALVQTVAGVQKARKQNVDLNTALATEHDTDTKLLIQKIKNENNIK